MPDPRQSYLADIIRLRSSRMRWADVTKTTSPQMVLAEHNRDRRPSDPASGRWMLGDGTSAAVMRPETVGYLRALRCNRVF
ncbi:MAG: hypothetical protein M3143_14355 [Actinomycetota bacterium]|nr:hypothetical protein [Actinomycetota bacterium]